MAETASTTRSTRGHSRSRLAFVMIAGILAAFAGLATVSVHRYRSARMDYELFLKAGRGDLASARDLLDRRANANARIYPNDFPPANLNGWIDLLVGRSKPRKQYSTPLAAAMNDAHTDVAKLLLVRGASNVNDRTGYSERGYTFLMLAARCGDVELAQMLLDRGANLEGRDWIKCTPLVHSLAARKWKVTKLFLDKGADADCRDEVGRTVFEYCIYAQTPPWIIDDLLKHGAKIDAFDQGVWTPLMLASSKGNLDTTKLLIQRGANVNLKNSRGSSAVSIATKHQRRDLVAVLRAAGAKE